MLPCDAEIIEKFRTMSKDSSKKNSKKDRKVQRSVFRDIHATLASGESPQISFTVKNEQLDVSSWKSVLQFEAIKNFLHVGLQQHIKYNNALRYLLDLPDTLEDRANDRVRCSSTPTQVSIMSYLTIAFLFVCSATCLTKSLHPESSAATS